MKQLVIFLCFLVSFISYSGINRFNIAVARENFIVFAQEEVELPVTLKLSLEPANVEAGGTTTAKLVVTVKEQFHIFSMKPGGGLKGSNLILYRSNGLTYGDLSAPPPQSRFVKVLKRKIEQYEGEVVFSRKVFVSSNAKSGRREINGEFQYQACNDNICLLPNKISVSVFLEVTGGSSSSGKNGSVDGSVNIERLFKERGVVTAIFLIFISGMALNLTPCVYPMIPVTISFFGGQTGGNLKKNFILASMYVLGMAVVYSVIGATASLTGSLFGSLLQNKWVILLVAGVFIALALSMFGLYEITPPRALTSRITMQKGYLGSFITGSAVGIVAAPCIGPFVLALLVFVGHLANPVLGFLLFFVFSLGLGVPYLFLGTFSSMLASLPKSGEWLSGTKKVFGTILLGMAVYYLKGVLPLYIFWLIISLFLLIIGTVLGGFWRSETFSLLKIAQKTLALLFIVAGSGLLWITISTSGNFNFEFWNNSSNVIRVEDTPIFWIASMEEGITIAKKENKPVLVDFYSLIWCPACIEFEKITYRDQRVIEEMKKFVNVKIDVDKNPEAQKLMERYNVKGIPTILFVDFAGKEISSARVTGWEEPELFLKSLNKAVSLYETIRTPEK